MINFNKNYYEPKYQTIEKVTKSAFAISSISLLIKIYSNNPIFLTYVIILSLLFVIVFFRFKSKFMKAVLGLVISLFSLIFTIFAL